jgi:hypothetical protein
MNSEITTSTIGASERFDPELMRRAIEVFGEDGAWLVLSQVWYGWRAYYDLACGVVSGAKPSPATDRTESLDDPYQVVVDLQVQAHLYSAAEQFATLLQAMQLHESGTTSFFDSYVGAPPDLRSLIAGLGALDASTMVTLVGDPADAHAPDGSEPEPLDLAAIPTVTVGGIHIPKRMVDRQALADLQSAAHEVIDLTIKNVGELHQLVDPPPPIAGADRQPQSLRAMDNSFRHGLRLLFHEASPTTRTFRVGAMLEPPVHPSVDVYLPGRSKATADAINYGTVSCPPDRTREHLEVTRQLSTRTGQLVRGFLGFQTTGRPDQLLVASRLGLPGLGMASQTPGT